jgi:hypothetical protein
LLGIASRTVSDHEAILIIHLGRDHHLPSKYSGRSPR